MNKHKKKRLTILWVAVLGLLLLLEIVAGVMVGCQGDFSIQEVTQVEETEVVEEVEEGTADHLWYLDVIVYFWLALLILGTFGWIGWNASGGQKEK